MSTTKAPTNTAANTPIAAATTVSMVSIVIPGEGNGREDASSLELIKDSVGENLGIIDSRKNLIKNILPFHRGVIKHLEDP